MAKKPAKLTPKQEKFCQEYMVDLNATQAAIRAGYSKKTANVIASQNLSKLNIQDRLVELKGKIQEKTDLTVESVIEDIKDTHRRAKLAEDEKPTELKASDMLMRHLGGYEKDNERQVIINHKPLTEEELKKRLAAVEAAGNGIDVDSIK